MADEKFSEFTTATSLDGTETLVGLQAGDNAQFPITFLPITVKVSLSSAEILQLFTTPKTLIAAPGAGFVIKPINQMAKNNYGTLTYSGNNMLTSLGGSSVFSTGVYTLGNDGFDLKSAAGFTTSTDLENLPLIATISSSNPITGDGTVDLYITYCIISL